LSIKSFIKTLLYAIAKAIYLREGSVRMSVIGPYRGLRFELSPLMLKRIDVYFRAYEPNVTDWLTGAVNPGMIVYVVGAHLGVHVLMIAKLLKGQGQVYAFEGWPENYHLLTRNIACNPQLGQVVTAFQQAVGKHSGTLRMAAGSADGKHHLMGAGDEGNTQIEVAATTPDDFWSKVGGCPDIILIDIEGFELDALEGGQNLLAACHPRLVLEHHGKAEALTRWLRQHDYSIEIVDKRHIFTR
jgi:FkbM family methyltransferase